VFEIDPKIQFAYDGLKPFLLSYEEAHALVGKTASFKRLKGASRTVEGAGECASIDLRIPAMPQGRASNDAGGRTFHMACRPISIEGRPTLDGEPYYPAGNKPRQASSSFESYLGRGGAAELLSTTSQVEYRAGSRSGGGEDSRKDRGRMRRPGAEPDPQQHCG
jgi:hypothetical protein